MTSKLDHFLSPYGTGLPCFVLLRRSTTPVENLSIPHGFFSSSGRRHIYTSSQITKALASRETDQAKLPRPLAF